jgi:hypothetical protein
VFDEIDRTPVLTFAGCAYEPDGDGNVEDRFCLLDMEYAITICNAGTEEIASAVLKITLADAAPLVM